MSRTFRQHRRPIGRAGKSTAREIKINESQPAIGTLSLGLDGRWIDISADFCRLLGYEEAGLRRLAHGDLLPPAERRRVEAFCLQLREHRFGPAKIETEYLRRDGSPLRMELRADAVPADAAGPERFELRVEDIGQREQRIRSARETAENYRLLLQSATEHAIIRLDDQGRVISWNPGAERILGYKEEEIIGRSSWIFFTPEEIASGEPKKELDLAREFGRGEDDRWQVRKDRTRFWASGITTPFRDETGRIVGFVKIFCDLTDRKIGAERALYLAQHDTLTGLPNRKKFQDDLVRVIDEARKSRSDVAVLFLDLDRFKMVNDSLGHHSGDQVLKLAARRLAESVRKGDLIARLSGDEFGVIAAGLESPHEAERLAAKLVKAMAEPFQLGSDEVTTGASIGVTVFPRDASDVNQLLINADLAMYRAKSQGRSTHVVYTDRLNDEAARRHALEEASRLALVRHEFELHYQPQYSLATNRICGMEALLRWHSPDIPMVTTSEIVSLADETGLIVQLGEWVLRTACAQLREWHDTGFSDVYISVNMSYRQIKEGNFLAMLDEVLADTGADPNCLELEITEGLLMEHTAGNMALLHALKYRGIKLSIDDFGTGFSSLSYLKNFPVDSLKIDQAFIKNLPDNRNDASITSAIIGLGHSMNLKVIAEGIETEQQARFLRERNCDCAQGHFFAKAMPADEVTRMLRGRKAAAAIH